MDERPTLEEDEFLEHTVCHKDPPGFRVARSVRTGLRQLDSTLSLLDRNVNILGLEGSRMDWPDLMQWQYVLGIGQKVDK